MQGADVTKRFGGLDTRDRRQRQHFLKVTSSTQAPATNSIKRTSTKGPVFKLTYLLVLT